MPPKKVVKEKVTRRKESDAGADMATEEGAEPSAPVAEDGGAPSASAPAPSLPPSAPATSVQVPNAADMAKAAAAARALQTRAEILSTNQLLVPQAAPSQPAAAPTALAAVQAQVNSDPETQTEADMEAMRHVRSGKAVQGRFGTYPPVFGRLCPTPSLSTSADLAPSATSCASANVLRRAAIDRSSASGPSCATASSTGHCPSTSSTAWPSAANNGRRGFGSTGAAPSFPSAAQPTPQHFKYSPFGPPGGEYKSSPCQVQDIIEASVINATSAGLLEDELTRKIANKEMQTLEHLLRIIDGFTRGEEDSKRWQAIQVEYDKASVTTAQAQQQVQVAEPPPLVVRQPQPAIQAQPPRQEDAEGVTFPHQDPLVISAEIAGFEVRRILVDGGSSTDVIFAEAYAKMGLTTQALTPAPTSLRGFGGEAVQVLGQAQLIVAFGTGENRREEQVLFDVVDIPYNYNAIFGRATLNKFEVISHHNYLKLKMSGPAGVIVIKGLHPSAASKGDLAIINKAVHNVEAEPHDRAKHVPKPAPHGKIIKMQIDDADPIKLVSLGGGDMGEEEAKNILEVLKKNIDIFAWGPDEVGGVSADLIMHHLAVKPDAKPRKQKLCKMSADRQEAAKAEVQKLLKAGVIQEIDHPEWLANSVLVRKSNGKWRMCVDFTDLNKACPKDDFPLPRIDRLVDSTAGCELMSFLDAYSGYHQIRMNPADIPKTAFITPFGTFCHLRMPFGLRNAGATFARLVYKVLYKQLGQNVEAYVDDIVVKSRKAFDHASDLQETFDNLHAAGMKLNPEKCVFGVRAGKLLGFLVSERGIEANPEKIDAIQQIKPPSSVREVQKLAGRIAALSRFLSKAAERGLLFFKTLRGAGKFNWTPECQAAFDELKQDLQSPLALISPASGSELLLYLAALPVAVSVALVQETDLGQKPVYFVSEALQGAKTRYIEMEKLAYALMMASRKLKHYFQAHKVIVPSQYPLGEILRVLADFVAKWTPAFAPEPELVKQPWVMYSDGSWSHKGAGVAAVVTSPNGVPIRYAARLQFDTTNNAAEYEAILLGLRKAKALGIRRLLIRTDSKLVAGYVDKSFEAKEEGMKRYLDAVRSMEKCFTGITVEHLPRGQNEKADTLAKSAACGGLHSPGILFEVLYAPSVPMDSLEVLAIDHVKLSKDPYD
uniref:Retrotransposon protein n=1 Tax=Oryza sativa subsp. japonica TaxID=39947 RepID=Q6AVL1_ORYSJ|nr:putative retrotransposon protein [Oryza sativa Japonica Group]